MVEPHWFRHSVRLGIVGVRRAIRGLRRNRLRVRLLAFTVITGGLGFGGLGVLFALALRSRTGPIPVPGQIRIGVTALWVFGVWFLAQRAILHWRRLRSEAFVLTTVSRRTAAVGMLITEFLNACVFLVLPTLLVVGVIGYAFRSPVSLLFVTLAVGFFAASALVVGYAFGFGYLFLSTRSRFIAQQEGKLIVQLVFVLVAAYLLVQPVVSLPAVWDVAAFEWLPVSWLVDVAVLGTPVSGSGTFAVAGLLGALVGIGVGTLLVTKLATAYWNTDPGTTARASNGSVSAVRGQSGTLAAAISPLTIPTVVETPTQRVAELVLLRLRRSPRRLLFLVTTIVSLGVSVSVLAVQSARPMALVPIVCAVFLPWIAGAVFGLNPLGDEGAALPATLTSSVSGRQFVRGVMLPGLLYGLPLTIVCTVVSSVLSPYPLVERVSIVLIGVVLTVVAVAFASGVGMRFPRFSAFSIEESREVVPPSITAVAVYSVGMGVLGGGAVLVLLTPLAIYGGLEPFGVSASAVRSAGVGCVLGVTVVVGWWGYRSAVQRFENYFLP